MAHELIAALSAFTDVVANARTTRFYSNVSMLFLDWRAQEIDRSIHDANCECFMKMRCNDRIECVNGHSSRFGECLFVADCGSMRRGSRTS
jgi:hypothetical protein